MKANQKQNIQYADVRRVQPPQPSVGAAGKRRKLRVVFTASALSVLLLLFVGTTLVIQHRRNNQPLDGKASLEVVEGRISKHFLLPTDEVPALATITDATKLNTPFFKRAETGDKILIYQKHKIAIMYRASIDRIVEVGPVSLGNLGGQ